MPDREKVIKGLEELEGFLFKEYTNIKAEESKIYYDRFKSLSDAIAMLKEQDEWLHKKQHDIDRLCNEISEWKHKFHDKSLKEREWKLLIKDDEGFIHGLPGDDGQYLMTDGEDIWIDDYVDGVDDGVWLDSGRDIREIKAWMHMPELPKKDRR